MIIDSWGPYLDDANHDVQYVSIISNTDLQTYREADVNYLVLNSINLSWVISASADPRVNEELKLKQKRIREIINDLPLERKFTGPALYNPPVIDVLIYKLQ